MSLNKKLCVITIMAILALTTLSAVNSVSAQSLTSWTLDITASSGSFTSLTTIGVQSDATTGFDDAYDLVVPPPPPTGVYSYLFCENNSASPVNLQSLSSDIISPSDNETYLLEVQNIGATGTVTLTWSSDAIVTNSMILSPSGTTINMKTHESYSWSADQGQVYEFAIVASTGPSPSETPSSGSGGGDDSPTTSPTQTQHPYTATPTPVSPTPTPKPATNNNIVFYFIVGGAILILSVLGVAYAIRRK